MSLIHHTTELNGANPFHFLVSLMRNHAFVEENPDEFSAVIAYAVRPALGDNDPQQNA